MRRMAVAARTKRDRVQYAKAVEERLNKIYNQMKHAESCIENGQVVPGAPVPVWLANTGLQSIDASLTFAETGDVLADLATYANQMMDPKGAPGAK